MKKSLIENLFSKIDKIMSTQRKIWTLNRLKNKHLGLSIYLLTTSCFATAYTGLDKTKANKILEESKSGKKYAPVLEAESTDNNQGKIEVYKNEYGVVILVDNEELVTLLKEVNAIAYPNKSLRPLITPHVTLVQGNYGKNKLKTLKKAVETICTVTTTKNIIFNKVLTKGGGGNTFLNVTEGKPFFNELTTKLTKVVSPDKPMKQVLDDILKGDADLQEMRDGGAWRDFNLPYNNNPHITVVYSKQDGNLLKKGNKLLKNIPYKFTPKGIAIFKIDYRGNLYGKPIYQACF